MSKRATARAPVKTHFAHITAPLNITTLKVINLLQKLAPLLYSLYNKLYHNLEMLAGDDPLPSQELRSCLAVGYRMCGGLGLPLANVLGSSNKLRQ